MPIGKELKKFPRECARVVVQAGKAMQGISDPAIMQIGEEIEQQGLSMMALAKNKLEETNNNVQANDTPCYTKDNNNAKNVIEEIPIQQASVEPLSVKPAQERQQLDVLDPSQDIVYIISDSEECRFDDLDEKPELSISSNSNPIVPTILFLQQENSELTKRIAKLEEQLIAKNQDIQNNLNISSSSTGNYDQGKENSAEGTGNKAEGSLHLVLRF